MFEFKGDLSGVSKEYALKKTAKLTQRFLLLGAVYLLPFSYIIFVTFLHSFWIFILPALFFISSIIARITYKMNTQKLSHGIYINGGTITADFKFNSQTLDISKVKAVHDYGEFYEIIPKNIFVFSAFICQKDLLTNGTLEEFETLFDGRIMQKSL